MATARVESDGGMITVTEGDYVCFKSDVEQSGLICRIEGSRLTLAAEGNGFQGDYIGGNHFHSIRASDCWTED